MQRRLELLSERNDGFHTSDDDDDDIGFVVAARAAAVVAEPLPNDLVSALALVMSAQH